MSPTALQLKLEPLTVAGPRPTTTTRTESQSSILLEKLRQVTYFTDKVEKVEKSLYTGVFSAHLTLLLVGGYFCLGLEELNKPDWKHVHL